MKKLVILLTISLSLILCSCNNRVYRSDLILPSPTPINKNIIVKTYKTSRLNSLGINLKNANITIASWGRKEAKVEIETVDLSNKATDSKQIKPEDIIQLDFTDDNLVIKEQIKTKLDYLNKITVYCPYDVKSLTAQIENGDFVSTGDLTSMSKLKIKKGNINLARFKGTLEAETTNGNIIIGSGKFNGASKVLCKSGNINVRTEILEIDSYKFETDVGNIELSFPAKTIGDFSCQGNVVSNAFKTALSGSKINVSSRQGSIVIKKY